MAVLKLLLSGARRYCLTSHSFQLPRPPFLGFNRSLCSSSPPSDSDQNPSSLSSRKPSESRSVPIETVYYAVKPKDQSLTDQDPSPEQSTSSASPPQPRRPRQSSPAPEAQSSWTREDIRYVKDVPPISSVSYPSRVAPLPDDKVSAEEGYLKEKQGESVKESQELVKERKQMEAVNQMRRKLSRVVEEEKVVFPFPTLIKVKKNERKPIHDLMEAIRQVKANAKCKFDETVEAHVKLGIDAKRAGRGVRGSMTLPHGSGKVVRVAFFAEGKQADEARAAGADIVGGVELVEEIASSNKINVDKCFATNEMVLRMGKISRILRERGLWPDRKLGTVTNDVSEALNKVRKGHMEFKMDRTSIVHVGLGKVSYSEDYLRENIGAFMNALLLAKPQGLKKASKYAGYITSFNICSTMGAGYSVSVQSLSKAADHYNKVYLK